MAFGIVQKPLDEAETFAPADPIGRVGEIDRNLLLQADHDGGRKGITCAKRDEVDRVILSQMRQIAP